MASYAVIGANYGDEGKGLITDFLARRHSPDYIVRFNGGAQAGHTVVAGNHAHVFKHLGAGTLVGIPTILSKHFICNPILFNTELVMLRVDGYVDVDVMVDGEALVTTPFDMMINQLVEDKRKAFRAEHGSCGVGINETVTRSSQSETTFKIRVLNLLDMKHVKLILQLIREMYIPHRLAALGFTKEESANAMVEFRNPVYIDGFIIECERFLKEVKLFDCTKLPPNSSVVFEGAQGLALDELDGVFPHVTRSRTGMTNVISLAVSMGINYLTPIYVTRAYLTRHGAGPLKNELPYLPVSDSTNVFNTYQGKLRFSYLDIDALVDRVKKDREVKSSYPFLGQLIEPAIAVTCLDQVEDSLNVYYDQKLQTIWKHDLPAFLMQRLGFKQILASEGPTADDVKVLQQTAEIPPQHAKPRPGFRPSIRG